MPRNYKKKRLPPSYTPEDMARAVEDIINKNKTYQQVEDHYGIPKAVVFNRIKGRKTAINKLGSGRSQALTIDTERDLENCIRARARMGIPCDKEDVKQVVAEYVRVTNLKTQFVNGIPGDDWYYSFMKRHPGLSVKKPELLQKCRKDSRDPFVIYDFYTELAQLFEEKVLKNKPSFVFNCDESGFCHDPSKLKAIGEKGKALTRISGGSGRESTTVLACISADGSCLPPLIVFKGVGVQARWTSDKVFPGTRYTCSGHGWMEEPQFFEWLSTVFVPHVHSIRASQNLPNQTALLLFDGHSSHISARTIKAAIQNNLELVKFPSHLTDKIQPLDKCVFGPIKKIWEKKLIDFVKGQLETRQSGRLSKSLFVELLGEVWSQGMKPSNIVRGFETTGLFPVNPKRFPESEFDPVTLKRYKESLSKNNIPSMITMETANGNIHCNEEPVVSTLPANIPIAGPSGINLIETRNSQNCQDIISNNFNAKGPDHPPNPFPSHTTPVKSINTSTTSVTPNTIINIFAEHSNSRYINQSDVKKVQRVVIPRLKPQKYGEILTTPQVLEKMEAAQKLRDQKKCTNKKQKDKNEKKTKIARGKKRRTVYDEEEIQEEQIDESALCQDDSSDDADILESIIAETTDEVEYHEPVWKELNTGLFVLVEFKGGQRNTIYYKYVCCIQSIDEEDGDIVVQGFERLNSVSTEFIQKPNDVSTITFEMIKAILPDPNLKYCDRKVIYVFPGTVAVYEK